MIKTRLLIAAVCLLMLSSGCVIRGKITPNKPLPVTFTVTGQPRDFFFAISEVAPENYGATPWNSNKDLNRYIWGINLRDDAISFGESVAGISPQIVYGQVPQGFEQKFPIGHEPESLQPGRIYEAVGGSSCCENIPEIIWFKIEGNQVIVVQERQ